MLVLNPGAHTDAGVLAGYLRTFNHQAGLIRKRGVALPWILVSYLQTARGSGPWFSWENAGNQCFVRENGACSGTDDWQRQGGDAANRPQGTGLGLPISRQIVEHFGGRLWLESIPGQGATFSFELPLASAAAVQ